MENPNLNPSFENLLDVTTITAAGTALGALSSLLTKSKKPMSGTLSGATMGFLFSTVNIGLEKYRRKKDSWNPAIGMGVASTVNTLAFGPHLVRPLYRLPVAASFGVVTGGVAFSVASLLDKYYLATDTSD